MRRIQNPKSKIQNRPGGTLVEVLMSVMIMAIGVVSVATMFPLSMARSIQATQLTQATVLRYNAESRIESDDFIVFDPDGSWAKTGISKSAKSKGKGKAKGQGKPAPDPNLLEHYNTTYVVDPVGFHTIKQENPDPAKRIWDRLGNDGGTPPTAVGKVLRFPGFGLFRDLNADGDVTDPGEALDLDLDGDADDDDGILYGRIISGLPDSWSKDLAEANAASISTNRKSIQFPAGVDLSSVQFVKNRRALIFDVTGTQSQVRMIIEDDPATAGVDEGISLSPTPTINFRDRLPDRIGTPGLVRIEVSEFRFSWMLLVRRQPLGDASIDVVCFQSRPFTARDETTYMTIPVNPPPNTTQKVDPVFRQHSDIATVQYNSVKGRPWVHKGGWVFDLQSAHWYRIQGYKEVEKPNGVTEIEMQLNQKASGDGRWAVFMRGVVDVYPIGVKTP